MKRSVVTTVILWLSISICNSQNFTWVKGANLSGLSGTYGTMGAAAPSNNPGGRHGCGTWTDAAGNLWLFGGEGYSSTSSVSWLNDLWKYDIISGQWTWIRGSNMPNALSVYGTQGVPAPGNDPGAREFMTTWTDASGNFWLFGGDGFGSASTQTIAGNMGDLWKYNPTTNQWAWMKGFTVPFQNGVYGTMGTAAPGNLPGGRYGAAGYTDNSGNLYLFAGRGYAATGFQGHLNDLWRYNTTTNNWTWIHGTNQSFQNGFYGALGVTSPTNMPGGRYHPSFTQDAAGNFYLFGGLGLPTGTNSAGYLNDTWQYSITNNSWTWINGPNVTNQNGLYGTMGVPSPTARPGGRYSSACWADPAGNIWLFGGSGFDNGIFTGNLNDLWRLNRITLEWTWLKGSNTMNVNGTYGTMGVPAPSNVPGSRYYNTRWTGSNGKFWLFGGEGLDASNPLPANHMQDLWVYSIPCNPDSIVSAPGVILCTGSSVTLTAYNTYSGNVNWFASPTSTSPIGSGTIYTVPPLTSITSPSVYSYYASTNSCSATAMAVINITVHPLPAIVITGTSQTCLGSTVSLTASGASTYTWSNGPTGTTSTLQPVAPTHTVFVIATSSAGCENSATKTITVLPLPQLTISPSQAKVCVHAQTPTLSVTGASTYTWNNLSTGSTFTVVSTTPTTILTTVAGEDLNGCRNTSTTSVVFLLCAGMDEFSSSFSGMKIFPNPAHGEFTVEALNFSNEINLTIFNCTGQKVFEKKIDSPTTQIIPDLAPGLYILVLNNKGSQAAGRLLIE